MLSGLPDPRFTLRKWKWSKSEVKVKAAQLCPTLCKHMGYTVHGILQARILQWVALPFSRGSSQPRSPALQEDSLPAEPQGKGQVFSWFHPSQGFLSHQSGEKLSNSCEGRSAEIQVSWKTALIKKDWNEKISLHINKQKISQPSANFGLQIQISSVQSCPTLWPHELQHARPPCPSPTPGVH